MELTEREKKLIAVINYLVKANTIFAYYENTFQEARTQRNNFLRDNDFTIEGYQKMMNSVNEEFGTNYEFSRQEDLASNKDDKKDGDQN